MVSIRKPHNQTYLIQLTSYLMDSIEIRKENIRVIIRHLILNDRCQTFQTHACVNTFRRKWDQCSIVFSIIKTYTMKKTDISYIQVR